MKVEGVIFPTCKAEIRTLQIDMSVPAKCCGIHCGKGQVLCRQCNHKLPKNLQGQSLPRICIKKNKNQRRKIFERYSVSDSESSASRNFHVLFRYLFPQAMAKFTRLDILNLYLLTFFHGALFIL